ncbi:TetR/AcrR family transcriptional regulator [Noviherbaspirillum denitrificans]|uniref:TetR family transcriptional regulator n=1 Tax=Noviherbaspirillum denitrificans TaxID=1968433 RepID=A0A254TA59_9BURK|nr:TetR/AcrR family transcriptional regulator [Noviherbaspirillum denitrificans]OWW19524.1 TetR family transcriptional regulator [Noviherbaspirillum denitrificans]
MKKKTAETAAPAPARRLNPEEREEQIVQKAIRYFAAHGFSASTRELAKEIGVTQPLLYRYFPSKEALVDRVFDEVYLSRWNPDWEDWLKDRSLPLKQRMFLYYKDYARIILKNEWIRIFIFAGLTREGINNRYLTRMREKIFDLVLQELRHEFGIATPTPEQNELEVELVWSLHASIFYIGVRKWVYGLPVPKDIDALIELKVASFLDGAPVTMRAMRKQST